LNRCRSRALRATLALLATLALGAAAPAALAAEPSVAVTLGKLRQGGLPQVLTIYGTVGASADSRRLLMAPLAATVTDLYVHLGQPVAKGAPLLRLVPSPANAAAYDKAKSALHVARQLVARTRAMVRTHLATDQQMFEAEKGAADAAAALAALTAQGAGGPQTLRAPVGAIVAKISTAPGALVAEGAPLVELAQPSGLVLQAGTVPRMALRIHAKDPVRLTPVGGGPALAGAVKDRSALVDPANGLVRVDISVPPGKALMGEMFRADVTIGTVRGYVVPHRAVLVDSGGGTYVVQSVRLTARKVPVRILAEFGDEDVLAGRLRAGSPIVLDGNYQATDGAKLRLVDPKAGGSK
jgi:multidrug efflux pump subunit AcrA (membrane-fusion protein)